MNTLTSTGLGDVLMLALNNWQPRDTHWSSAVFSAAGPRGFEADRKKSSLTQSVDLKMAAENDPIQRMFDTDIGISAAKAIGNETRALTALQRLCVEILAEAMRITGQAVEGDRLLVIPGRESWPPVPPILMLMSPKMTSVQDSRIISNDLDLPLQSLVMGLNAAVDMDEKTPEATVSQHMLANREKAIAEVFLIAQPEIILTRRPRMIPLCVPSPHMQIKCGVKVSTAGLLCHDYDGELGVTGSYHGTGQVGTHVIVAQQLSRVKLANETQDLVFIPLRAGIGLPQLVGHGGVCEDREPAKADRVRFDGAINQNKDTRIFGCDNGLLRSRPTLQLKIQTDPDTDQGDSGSALLDEHDRVLGFAFERTAYDDYPQFTDWIWADNALRALKLVPYTAEV